MKKGKQAEELIIENRKINCPLCGHDQFWTRRTLLNTRGASFFSFDWLNRDAVNKVCDNCGHMLWFHE
jgi:ribosomal protein S27AE